MTKLSPSTTNAQQIMGLNDDHLHLVCAARPSAENLGTTCNNSKHFLQEHVAQAFLDMQQAAAEDGVDLQICSSFRSFEKQLSIWNRKWQGQLPLLDANSNTIDTMSLDDTQKIHAIMLWSALPGASRHHWGTDFDVYDKHQVISSNHDFLLVPSEYEGNGPCANLNNWMSQHAQSFGFYRPYAVYTGGVSAEPWHFSYQATACKIESEFSLKDLKALLDSTNICGKETILSLLPTLFERYTLNKGLHQ